MSEYRGSGCRSVAGDDDDSLDAEGIPNHREFFCIVIIYCSSPTWLSYISAVPLCAYFAPISLQAHAFLFLLSYYLCRYHLLRRQLGLQIFGLAE